MKLEVTRDYGSTPFQVTVTDGTKRFVISADSVMFDQYSRTPCLKIEEQEIERIRRCQAAVARKAKDYSGNPRDLLVGVDPDELVADQCKRAAAKDSEVCAQHRDTHNGGCGDAEEYLV